ncbi:MAG: nitroreductase family protein [Maritimibacter sp.]
MSNSEQSQGANADDLAPPIPDNAVSHGIWRLKTHLQFSGWLQFFPPFFVALLLALLGAAFIALGGGWLGRAILAGALVLAALGLFDVVVSKLRLIRLPEPTPTPVEGDVFAMMHARRATRAFQPKPLENVHRTLIKERLDFHTAIDSADAIEQGVMRAVLLDAPLKVWPAFGAQTFVVVLGPKTYNRLAVIEAGRAVQHVVNEATAAGISTCWIGPGADRSSVEAALGAQFDASQDHVLCVVALGYGSRYRPLLIRLAAFTGKRRKPMADLMFEEAPGLPAPLGRAPYKGLRPVLEACRGAPSSYNSQTSRLIMTRQDKTLIKAQFCCEEGSQYYAPLALGIWCANWETGMKALGVEGRWITLEEPRALAGGLVHDLSWKPARQTNG